MKVATAGIGEVIAFMIIAAFVALPIVLTGYNFYFFVKPFGTLTPKKQRTRFLCYLATPILGELCQGLWISMFVGVSMKQWNEPIITGGASDENFHSLTASGLDWWMYTLLLLSVLAVWFMNVRYDTRKPPLVSVLLIGLAASANVVSLLYCIQLSKNLEKEANILVLYVLPVNWLLITLRTLADEFASQVKLMRENGEPTGLNAFLCKLFTSNGGRFGVIFTSLVPIAAVVFIIQILAGQGADAFVKTFTDTADWTFSQQTPPPPEYYEGHYLCTVAAGGHHKLVKPTRYGVRRGERIIVNRQLCIANAFEDLIAERTPRFHKAVRGFYDRHGYPICRFITTPLRADITYLLMKPLEWVFLAVLYLFDPQPERRIARQYTGR
ncbi:hypothetical protein SAMN02910447_00947 [Ruminococcus sp. YE71]|uniref:DUF6688 domain-containing protein n=1 Tax=unclassified Ruminococcus TaxID=2608920 RepID=UPI000891CCDC|nr:MULTISPECIES: DUF6688 family protein [unclassified Ruminococcus]SDA15530.1 hypothetical protein SAMN02910446_00946 [Ruminococcus sp. YE78]SFW22722.1 hypothetical protein SAMN02910447_00947 [Ruminococcus sp. YE71]